MCGHLLEAGYRATIHSRTRARAEPLVEGGAEWADSPAAVAAASDVVFTMVTNTAAVKAVTEGADGILAGLAPGKVYVDMSTASPANTRALAEEVAAIGALLQDLGPVDTVRDLAGLERVVRMRR